MYKKRAMYGKKTLIQEKEDNNTKNNYGVVYRMGTEVPKNRFNDIVIMPKVKSIVS
jgi:hypothetical protein